MLDVKLPFVVQLFSRYIFDMRFLEMSCTIFWFWKFMKITIVYLQYKNTREVFSLNFVHVFY